MLYDKHKGIFAEEVDDIVGKFGQGLKELQRNRMAALLRDVGDAIASSEVPNFSFEAHTTHEGHDGARDAQAAPATADVTTEDVAVSDEPGKSNDAATNVTGTNEQPSKISDAECNILPQSPPLFFNAPRSAAAGIWDDEPSFELFEKGSEEYVWLHSVDEPTNKTSNPTVPPVSDNERRMDSPVISSMLPLSTTNFFFHLCFFCLLCSNPS